MRDWFWRAWMCHTDCEDCACEHGGPSCVYEQKWWFGLLWAWSLIEWHRFRKYDFPERNEPWNFRDLKYVMSFEWEKKA